MDSFIGISLVKAGCGGCGRAIADRLSIARVPPAELLEVVIAPEFPVIAGRDWIDVP
jgi:hypothetical protein